VWFLRNNSGFYCNQKNTPLVAGYFVKQKIKREQAGIHGVNTKDNKWQSIFLALLARNYLSSGKGNHL
jgi:hypothetical protein